jgi:4'-phosphopantetheinyl transferase
MINEASRHFGDCETVDLNELTGPGPTLSANDVHVWHACLDDHPTDDFRRLLTEDEISRANRFHFTKDKDHYVVARGLLRRLLGGYLGVSGDELRFVYAEKGKPALAESQGSLLTFNLAHSQGRAIFVFSLGREVGVDLEFMREDFTGDKIAQRFFSQPEIAALATVPLELKQRAFFDCWTRKEAYIKARGDGLSMPLDEFDVAFAPGEEAALLRNQKQPEEVTRWKMQSIPAPEGYVAAVVIEGYDWKLKTFRVV